MKIAINCWVLRNRQLDGIGYFTVNTISSIIRDNPGVQFQILCDKKFSANYFDYPNVTKHFIFPPWRHPVLYVLYMELVLPLFLRKHKPDLLLSMEGFLSLLSGYTQVPVMYDINFAHFPEGLTLKNRLYMGFFYKRFAKKAAQIITISEYSKQDIANTYQINPAKIDIVYCGVNSIFSPLTIEKIRETRTARSGGKPYFFFVGSMHPRKNIKRLIEAFSLFKKQTGAEHKLLLAGSIWWSKSEIEVAHNESAYKDDIIFTGRLSDEDLRDTLGAAFALAFVPTFEGFGIPIVEAMQCEVPVICSNVTSMPEVAGDAAILVDPFSIDSISEGMIKLYKETGLGAELIARANVQKQKFSWQNTSRLLWQSVLEVIAREKLPR
jgi:glycosyltransferase involved in cell wall biosynthesis